MSQQAQPGLKSILLATDFSPRSDRATRRALLLAKQFQARITIVHVVDDEQPKRLMESARAEAGRLLAGMSETFQTVDHVDCSTTIAMGEAFAGTLATAEDLDVDLIIIGPHRRQILKDVFTGTTAERIIRESHRPVLMVNGPPTGGYRNALLASDKSPASLNAYRVFEELVPIQEGARILLHIFNAPAASHLRRASSRQADIEAYVATEERHAEAELRALLQQQRLKPDQLVLRSDSGANAADILVAAKAHDADLIVVGNRGQTMPARLLLGSTTEALLRISDRDVLAVPGVDR